ncbi:hypothetical protein OL239_11685 [Arthrobacter sp. ATA002]|uniref:hypothetical protein n=1 Tax=Arthrobacter sp. ATA002 TaxID=2991715 RepID=UPI0022A6AA74|nr:hypothetical protein [Arthrobacter sp. ATA002]WAP50685.1 hypothetical protein OL239_11685 [Arthrobacter sp. ATA002]
MSETIPCHTLFEAVVRAVREVAPAAAALDQEHTADELEQRIRTYWGPEHGIGRTEMLATARDTVNAAGSEH